MSQLTNGTENETDVDITEKDEIPVLTSQERELLVPLLDQLREKKIGLAELDLALTQIENERNARRVELLALDAELGQRLTTIVKLRGLIPESLTFDTKTLTYSRRERGKG